MAALFGKSQKIPNPKPVRAPNPDDPDILDAGRRAKASARGRKGRQSTLLTDAFRNGSSGQSLGR